MRNHPARSARILSAGLSTSALFGLITVFTMNQANADLENQNKLLLQQSASNQLQVSQTTTTSTSQKVAKQANATGSQQQSAQNVNPVDSANNQVAPAVPSTSEVTEAQPAAPNVVPPTPAPASNATTGGSK